MNEIKCTECNAIQPSDGGEDCTNCGAMILKPDQIEGLSEQDRQAALGIPDNDGVQQKVERDIFYDGRPGDQFEYCNSMGEWGLRICIRHRDQLVASDGKEIMLPMSFYGQRRNKVHNICRVEDHPKTANEQEWVNQSERTLGAA
jgi:hypothetical protein